LHPQLPLGSPENDGDTGYGKEGPPEQLPTPLANKFSVQREIVERDMKRAKSKDPFYQTYFAELLVGGLILIAVIVIICWYNVTQRKYGNARDAALHRYNKLLDSAQI
jgi:hypothetical protein